MLLTQLTKNNHFNSNHRLFTLITRVMAVLFKLTWMSFSDQLSACEYFYAWVKLELEFQGTASLRL